MKNWLRQQWHDYYKPAYRIVAFTIAGIIMVLSFPNMEKFKYEYELQRPWRYENVIAPFDFQIYKADNELQQERDSISNHFRPFYKRDSVNVVEVQSLVSNTLRQYASKFSVICPESISSDTVKAYVSKRLSRLLYEAYSKGIMEPIENTDNPQKNVYEFMLVQGNIIEPYGINEVYTLREAYSQITDELNSYLSARYGADNTWTRTLVERMPISEMINANILYDKDKTAQELETALNNISLSSGKVLAGQRIIGTGDIVDKKTVKLLNSLKRVYDSQYSLSAIGLPIYIGEGLMVACLLITVFLFLYFFRNDIFQELNCINFILLLMTLMVAGAGLIARHHGNITFIIPYVILPIILRIFLDSRLAMYVHTITILIISFMANNSQQFILMHIPAGMIAIISLINMTRRGQIVRTAIMVFFSYLIIYTGYGLWHSGEFDNSINPYVVLMLGINGALILFSYPVIYIFERLFGFLSDVTLMELSDTNHPLLRELSEKAPGTFQHSVQVGNLAQEVAYKIGANAMLVRTGAMYHDIGKIVSPMYFTENQAGNINPHDGMDFRESAQIVIRHVENGVRIARKHNIPQQVINIIQRHHGDSQARFFYVSYCNAHPNETVDTAAFSYPGPVPSTKEEALVMMADAVEASAKSLKTYTDENIDNLVDKIITLQTENNQFREADITFKNIEIAKAIFKEKLKNIYHGRIQYPEMLK
ncbi:MAG: HDIG domain-containing protein [Bacteroidales bacterium]|nr:HDIG domain-containing protein [Bacteroidales bacterium]